jgi:hypothetical protein
MNGTLSDAHGEPVGQQPRSTVSSGSRCRARIPPPRRSSPRPDYADDSTTFSDEGVDLQTIVEAGGSGPGSGFAVRTGVRVETSDGSAINAVNNFVQNEPFFFLAG